MNKRRYAAGILGVWLATLGVTVGVAQDSSETRGAQIVKEAQRRGLLGGVLSAEIGRIITGFDIAPVELNLAGKNLVLVGLGSYLVNAAGGCNDCHTNPPYEPGGNPFLGEPKQVNVAGYLAGGMLFGAPGDPNALVSRNLTPQGSTGRPAGLTFPQFRRTIRTGIDLKNLPPHVPSEDNDLLQVMPWPVYQELTDRDLRAIYEYLRAIPSLPSAP